VTALTSETLPCCPAALSAYSATSERWGTLSVRRNATSRTPVGSSLSTLSVSHPGYYTHETAYVYPVSSPRPSCHTLYAVVNPNLSPRWLRRHAADTGWGAVDVAHASRRRLLTLPDAAQREGLVVVGSGTSLLGSNLGAVIDSFKEVVRFNLFVTKGFEADVGSYVASPSPPALREWSWRVTREAETPSPMATTAVERHTVPCCTVLWLAG
jgi:hypothetical protein